MTGATPPYPNAPLALVLLEVRHSATEPLTTSQVATVKAHLLDVAPLPQTDHALNLQFQVMGVPGAQPSQPELVQAQRFVSRNRRTCITFTPVTATVETTEYVGWTEFRQLASVALAARRAVDPPDGCLRIGLRYIDEIRIPEEVEPDWSKWVSNSLLPPIPKDLDFSLRPVQQQALVAYSSDTPSHTLTVRYGAVDGPPTVISAPHLERPALPPPGPYFLIDTDAAWTITSGVPTPEFNVDFIIETANELHTPAKAVFEALITEDLRGQVFNG